MIIVCKPFVTMIELDYVRLHLYYKKSNKSLFCKSIETHQRQHPDIGQDYNLSLDDLIGIPFFPFNKQDNFKYFIVLKNGKTIITSNDALILEFVNNKALAKSVTNLRDFKTMVSI